MTPFKVRSPVDQDRSILCLQDGETTVVLEGFFVSTSQTNICILVHICSCVSRISLMFACFDWCFVEAILLLCPLFLQWSLNGHLSLFPDKELGGLPGLTQDVIKIHFSCYSLSLIHYSCFVDVFHH